MWKTYARWWTLGWGIPEVSLILWKKKKKIQREKDRKENPWRAVEQFLIVFLWTTRGPSHTLKGRTFFFIIFAKTFITQMISNSILYHWHASPAISYGKLLVLALFFFKIFPVPTSFSFFLICSWWQFKRKQQDSNSTSSPDKSILRIFYNFSSCT